MSLALSGFGGVAQGPGAKRLGRALCSLTLETARCERRSEPQSRLSEIGRLGSMAPRCDDQVMDGNEDEQPHSGLAAMLAERLAPSGCFVP